MCLTEEYWTTSRKLNDTMVLNVMKTIIIRNKTEKYIVLYLLIVTTKSSNQVKESGI